VLRGGSNAVGQWATDHGFRLPPDSPEVLDFYATRFADLPRGVFDADAARDRGQAIGDGTPVHVTIPTDNPWGPAAHPGARQDGRRARSGRCLPHDRRRPRDAAAGDWAPNGLTLTHSAAATDSLLDDLRSDKGMGWVPSHAWLSKVAIDAKQQI
jgi:hypothetical protein